MIGLSLLIIIASLSMYVMVGTVVDLFENRRLRQQREAMSVLSRALYADHGSLAPMMHELRSISKRVLFGLALQVPLHFDDQLSQRLLAVVGTTTVRRKVRRLALSRFWVRRVRAARLVHILPATEDVTERLLHDSNSSVRAATIETFGFNQVALFADDLLIALEDRSKSVRFTAQQALLRGDGRLVAAIARELPNFTGELALRGLEVASALSDPRLLPAIRSHAGDPDPLVRRLVARATPFGALPEDLDFFVDLLEDDDPGVRVAAIGAIARVQAEWFAARVGNLLLDRSWEVRRAAGDALAQLGPIGVLILRSTLDGDDPFAHDMAHQVLDALVVDGRLPNIDNKDFHPDLDSLATWAAA